jgi:uncharacterized protein
MSRAMLRLSAPDAVPVKRIPTRVALWLLDNPHLGQAPTIKRFAGRLLKQPAMQGEVLAQSRLGRLLCRDCGNPRDRRIGMELLRKAARAGDSRAQLELGQLCHELGDEPQQTRHWLELAAGQGCKSARALLEQL